MEWLFAALLVLAGLHQPAAFAGGTAGASGAPPADAAYGCCADNRLGCEEPAKPCLEACKADFAPALPHEAACERADDGSPAPSFPLALEHLQPAWAAAPSPSSGPPAYLRLRRLLL